VGVRGIGAARAHLRYIERDGTQRDGSPGAAYSTESDATGARSFIEKCDGDRHQFRLIVSAEDGAEYEDLKPLVRRFMAIMEQDLGTHLEWVAVDHTEARHRPPMIRADPPQGAR
jgi:type IV secretory pathway VirD2 relaxase